MTNTAQAPQLLQILFPDCFLICYPVPHRTPEGRCSLPGWPNLRVFLRCQTSPTPRSVLAAGQLLLRTWPSTLYRQFCGESHPILFAVPADRLIAALWWLQNLATLHSMVTAQQLHPWGAHFSPRDTPVLLNIQPRASSNKAATPPPVPHLHLCHLALTWSKMCALGISFFSLHATPTWDSGESNLAVVGVLTISAPRALRTSTCKKKNRLSENPKALSQHRDLVTMQGKETSSLLLGLKQPASSSLMP